METTQRVSIIASLAAAVLFLFSLVTGRMDGYITIDTYVYSTSLGFTMLLMAVSAVQILTTARFKLISFYFAVMLAFTFTLMAVLTVSSVMFPFLVVSSVLEAVTVIISSRGLEMRAMRTAVPLIALIIMIYLGNLFQFVFNRPDTGIVIESTQSVFVALGQNIPFLEFNGLFVLTRHFDLILSFQQYVLFFTLAILISENYYQIVRHVSRRGRSGGKASLLVYGLTGALSCQCESYIAFLPAFSILLINDILFPAILFSLSLLAGTYYLISRVYSRERRLKALEADFYRGRKGLIVTISAFILLGTPVFVTLVVYMSLLSSALFFFLTGMIMIIDGYIIVLLISGILGLPNRLGRRKVLLVLLGSALVFLWFIPSLTRYAFEMPGYFVLMNVSMLCGGLLYGLVYVSLEKGWKDVLNEYLSALFGIFSLVIFYIMVRFQTSIWPFFTLQSQVEFALVSWTIMLPVMWLTTQISLNRISAAGKMPVSLTSSE